MTQTYRLRYRKGDVEIEVESGDQGYTNTKFGELMSAYVGGRGGPPRSGPTKRKKPTPDQAKKAPGDE